ncbi:hypothetical protein F751_1483 [Auxenochlorella protothecoides]|uniref:Uncharacterized protein n=1 Tax=Auxenochlorella protothecoides TaxID=3075 RepID=A0A087SJG5_AUXPR|nr:hypothetical protein F751_1483 [Auxenochlorella protothecoides]KFM25869.1 hypothetical protein F751_1483 [Auxenochlorella protothecoides]RMZ55818.1 hypothetical protein APUTEX25_003784 [Auxenochlorella protothecoides]|eukprot:RMZ55818.1 hypothetical protein APUTEX25_003784 [Auxenochlorella protothecoides]
MVTIICSLVCAAAFGMAIAVRVHAPDKDIYYLSGQAVRVYGLLTAILVVFVELEVAALAAWWPLLEIWIGRAMLQSFVGVLTYREALPRGDTDFHRSLALYRGIASVALLVCSGVYAVGWISCLVRTRRDQRLRKAQAEYEALERRRAELQRLLVTEPAI